jgi:predicted AAA+ superfamily ATPase
VAAPYTARLVDIRLDEAIAQLPAILITGPRATGKTTTAARHATTIVRCDRPADAAALRADADATLRRMKEPVLLDEWQDVPDVLGAVKRAVDDDPRPGRFLLTGSVRSDLDAQTWPGTGRIVSLSMYGLTVRESHGHVSQDDFIDRLSRCDLEAFPTPAAPVDLVDYIQMALAGGYPETMLRLSGTARDLWLDSYVEQLITRDALTVGGPRDPSLLRRYLEVLALNSAGIATDRTVYDAVGISRMTYVAYERLLENLLVLDLVPAWATNRLKRLTRGPKRYLVDPALLASCLRLDVDAVLADADLRGRLIDTFVASQLRAELALSAQRPRLFHLRQQDGRREVDLVIELGGQRVLALEVKAGAAPDKHDARHLRWLRDNLGDRFVAGAVLHTGPHPYELDDRILALPIASLWVA